MMKLGEGERERVASGLRCFYAMVLDRDSGRKQEAWQEISRNRNINKIFLSVLKAQV
jgi:hypothetical protein